MSGGYEWDSDPVEDSRPVSRASSPGLPRLTSTLLVPTTIPNVRSLDGDVVRATDVIRPLRPARGTRPMLRSSVSSRPSLLSSMRDRSVDPLPLESSIESPLHDPNNEAPAARRSALAISGSRRGVPSSLAQRSHVFASIRDRSRTDSAEARDVSEDRTPEE